MFSSYFESEEGVEVDGLVDVGGGEDGDGLHVGEVRWGRHGVLGGWEVRGERGREGSEEVSFSCQS